jgi:hypothetical protein
MTNRKETTNCKDGKDGQATDGGHGFSPVRKYEVPQGESPARRVSVDAEPGTILFVVGLFYVFVTRFVVKADKVGR